MKSYSGKPPFSLIPPELQDLLGSPIQKTTEGYNCLGTGTILLSGVSRSGKTTLAYGLIDWVIHHTNRPVFLSNFPEIVIKEGLPKHWENRVFQKNIQDLYKVKKHENGVWLVDDSAVHTNSRDYSSRKAKAISRLSGIFSHIGGGQTIIYTTQNLAGVDKTLFRFTETVLVCRYMSATGIKSERQEFSEEIETAQYLLRQAHASIGSNDKRLREFYITISNSEKSPYRIVPYVKPEWLYDLDARKADMLSRPFRYMPEQDLENMVLNHDIMPDKKKVKQ